MKRSIEYDPQLGTIMRLATAFYGSKTLLTAVELDLFSTLSDNPATVGEVRDKLGLHPRGAHDFLDALVALGLLRREDDRYHNTPVVDRFLVRGKPDYVGGFIELYNDQLFPLWTRFTESLRTGKPLIESPEIFDELYEVPDAKVNFLSAMDVVTRLAAPGVVQSLDWTGYRTFVDVGGATGSLSAELVRSFDHLHGICFDLPTVREPFERLVAKEGLSERIEFRAGDFFNEPLPEADVLILGHILHDWDLDRRRLLLDKAFAALPPGGSILVYDSMIDDDRRTAIAPLLLSLNLLVVSPGGSQYTFAECAGWLREAGFTDITRHELGVESLAVARKPEA